MHERNALRLAATHRDQRDALTAAGTGNARQRKATRERLAITQRDEWQREHGNVRLTAAGFLRRVLTASERIRGASEDERNEAAARLMLTLASGWTGKDGRGRAGLGWEPRSADVPLDYCAARIAGLIANERKRQARAVPLPDEGTDEERSATGAAIRRDVWAAFTDEPRTAGRVSNTHPALLTAALERVLRAALTANERLAVAAAVNGWGSALEIAAALDVSEPAARKRLQRGRDELRIRTGSPDVLADALAAAIQLARFPRNRPALTTAQRNAGQLVERTRRGTRCAAAHNTGGTRTAIRRPVARHRIGRTARMLAALSLAARPCRCAAVRWTLLALAARMSRPVPAPWDDVARVKPYRPATRLRVALATVDGQRVRVLR